VGVKLGIFTLTSNNDSISFRSEPKGSKMTECYKILHNGQPINCTLPQPGRDLFLRQ